MSHVSECHGRIEVGELPGDLCAKLAALPGQWLEFDPEAGAIVVRHVEPTEAPVLVTTASELVRILNDIPYDLQLGIPGGALFVHTEATGELVRLRVKPGGAISIEWAHPAYEGAARKPYADGHEIAIEPWEQRLNGRIEFISKEAETAAEELQELADTFEGLYPEGDFQATADGSTVRVDMADVNLDVRQLVDRLLLLADPSTLFGRVDVSSFGDALPEHMVRFLFETGEVWVQHPLLWPAPSD
jgi:hypothetical protein